MLQPLYFRIAFLLILLTSGASEAQIRTNRTDVQTWVRDNFASGGVVIGDIKFSGNRISAASFTTDNVLALRRGLILSTGSAYAVGGLNNRYNQSFSFGRQGGSEKDKDLEKILKEALYDISLVEFDFVPYDNSLEFNYQFGSEEYPEYVGSPYNDIFAFFISDADSSRNIARIPGTEVPVSINTVNHKSNTGFFIDNNVFSNVSTKRQAPVLTEEKRKEKFVPRVWAGIKRFFGSSGEEAESARTYIGVNRELVKKADPVLYRNLQYDGITKKLTAQAYVTPYKKYHLKIVIADVSDNIYDSGVFIEEKSFISRKDITQPGFVDYPDFKTVIDPKQILSGKKLEELLPDSISMEDAVVYFDFDKSDIKAPELNKIRKIAALYQQVKNSYAIQLSGHTDSIGNLEYNMALSDRRNRAVIESFGNILGPEVIPATASRAFLQPVAANITDEGRSRNRRVEIKLVRK